MIIIDDRIVRQKNYLTSFDINDYKGVVENCVGDRFTKLQESFKDKQKISEVLSAYDVVAIHRSAFDASTRIDIDDFLKTTSKKMVLFSGGISSSSLVGNVLNINSKDFYSENLKLFCEMLNTSNHHLSVLQFGERWELSLILGFREQLIMEYNRYKEASINVRLESVNFFDNISGLIEITVQSTKVLNEADFDAVINILNKKVSSFLS